MARLRDFCRRLRRCWALLWDPAGFAMFDRWTARGRHIDLLLSSPLAACVRSAVEKNIRDPSFHPTKDHELKRREAEEWARTYARENGVTVRAWPVSFLIEWIVGERKGIL